MRVRRDIRARAGRFAGPTCIPFAHALPERLGQWVFVVAWQGGGGGLGENGAEGWEGGGAGTEVGFRGESGWVGVGGVAATTAVWAMSSCFKGVNAAVAPQHSAAEFSGWTSRAVLVSCVQY